MIRIPRNLNTSRASGHPPKHQISVSVWEAQEPSDRFESDDNFSQNAMPGTDGSELNGRGERIRTSDPLVPNQVRYQTALRPENCFAIMLPNRRGAHPWSRHLGCACKARVFDSYEFIRVSVGVGKRPNCRILPDLRPLCLI